MAATSTRVSDNNGCSTRQFRKLLNKGMYYLVCIVYVCSSEISPSPLSLVNYLVFCPHEEYSFVTLLYDSITLLTSVRKTCWNWSKSICPCFLDTVEKQGSLSLCPDIDTWYQTTVTFFSDSKHTIPSLTCKVMHLTLWLLMNLIKFYRIFRSICSPVT